jgi:hypothetical protein
MASQVEDFLAQSTLRYLWFFLACTNGHTGIQEAEPCGWVSIQRKKNPAKSCTHYVNGESIIMGFHSEKLLFFAPLTPSMTNRYLNWE